MKNQFVYTREVQLSPTDEHPDGEKVTIQETFNITKVLRTYQPAPEVLVVVLDDLHERVEERPATNKSGKITGVKNVKVWHQSEIQLSKEDTIKFLKELTHE